MFSVLEKIFYVLEEIPVVLQYQSPSCKRDSLLCGGHGDLWLYKSQIYCIPTEMKLLLLQYMHDPYNLHVALLTGSLKYSLFVNLSNLSLLE